MNGFGRRFSAGLVLTLALGWSSAAHAADGAGETTTSATGKGIVGGALLGGEAVMLVEAAADVQQGWAYGLGGGLGAVAGGVGGWFAEDKGSARLSMYLLVGGMALAIPTTVAVLSATAYEPVNYTEDRPPPADEPVAEPPQPTGPAAAPESPPPVISPPPKEPGESRLKTRKTAPVARAVRVKPALVAIDQGSLTLSVPAVEVRQAYTRTEVAVLGVKQHTEVEVPMLSVVF
jgi:hypothetical protein